MSSLMNTGSMGDKSEFSENLTILRQITFFSGFSIEIIKLLAFLCKRQNYKAGDVIFHQDDDDQCSYYILSGRVKLVLLKNGNACPVQTVGPDHFFGILSLMTPMMKPLSLIADEDTTCIVMTRKAFSKVVDQFPDIPLIMAKALGQRILRVDRRAIMAFENDDENALQQLLGLSLI